MPLNLVNKYFNNVKQCRRRLVPLCREIAMLILCVSHKKHAGNKKKPYKRRLRAPRGQTQPARHATFWNGPGTGAATVNDFDSAFFFFSHLEILAVFLKIKLVSSRTRSSEHKMNQMKHSFRKRQHDAVTILF